jgi:hypothetical protein
VNPKPREKLHENAAQTEERSYERLRESGVDRDAARKIASQAARETHESIDRRR